MPHAHSRDGATRSTVVCPSSSIVVTREHASTLSAPDAKSRTRPATHAAAAKCASRLSGPRGQRMSSRRFVR